LDPPDGCPVRELNERRAALRAAGDPRKDRRGPAPSSVAGFPATWRLFAPVKKLSGGRVPCPHPRPWSARRRAAAPETGAAVRPAAPQSHPHAPVALPRSAPPRAPPRARPEDGPAQMQRAIGVGTQVLLCELANHNSKPSQRRGRGFGAPRSPKPRPVGFRSPRVVSSVPSVKILFFRRGVRSRASRGAVFFRRQSCRAWSQ